MSASSGLKGQCYVCGHMYNEHNRDKCKGRDKQKDKNGKKKWVKCTRWWYICQQSHESERPTSYQVCHNCPSHPGGGPSETEPDGSYSTADNAQEFEDGWEWDPVKNVYFFTLEDGTVQYDQTGAGSAAGDDHGQTSTNNAKHTRNDSRDSEDPLAWTQERYHQETEAVDDLASALEQVQISKAEPDNATYVETYRSKDHLCFKNKGKEVKTNWSDWSGYTMEDGTPWFYWVSGSGRSFWTWELAAQEEKKKKHHKR